MLQGGGALGSYQAGVYAGLVGCDAELDWVAGVSIGAINAALIAGNAPEHRVARLLEFWQLVSSGPFQGPNQQWADRAALNQWSAFSTSVMGVPGLFRPTLNPALLLGGAAPMLAFTTLRH